MLPSAHGHSVSRSPRVDPAAALVAEAELTSPNVQSGGIFGYSVAVGDRTVVVGAPFETASGDGGAGHAYTFNAKTGVLISTLTSPDAQAGGSFGYSVAVSGTTVVVGAPSESVSGVSEGGHAYTFNRKTGALISTFTSPNVQVGGRFGWSVAVSGTTIVVGAPFETVSGDSEAGRAYAFNAKSGTLISTLTSPSAQTDGLFGNSVAISSATVVVGAPGETVSGESYAGHAYSFDATTGALFSTFTSPNAEYGGGFGSSVAVGGTTVVVGAPDENASGDDGAGDAYTFSMVKGALMSTLASPDAQTRGYFGDSVSISGATVVVGAYGETASGVAGAGDAYTFDRGALMATVTSPDAQTDSDFGTSVAISGTTVVAGAPYETAAGDGEGGHTWTFDTSRVISTLTSPNEQASGYFGYSVGVSGTTVVVGASDETVSGDSGAGRSYTFNSTTSALTSTLTSPNAQTAGYFGWSVAVSGTTVVVGAFGENVSGDSDAGHAYVFNAKSGALIATLTSPNAQYLGYFGYSVAVSGTTVVVGAPFETAAGDSYAGHAYTFNAKTGALTSTLTSPNVQTDGFFGWSVAVSGATVAVGATQETASGDSFAGHAYTFDAKTGALISTLASPNVQTDGYFGWSVAVSGTTVVVGADSETAAGDGGAGHAYTFNTKTGTLISTLTSPNAQTGGSFGWSVAVSGTTVVVGAPDETASGDSGAGHAYTFNAKTGAPISTLTSPNLQDYGNFGNSVAISRTTLVVGAPYEWTSGLSYGGHAYLS